MKENSAHGFTEGSEVPKEQDAAHSFDELIEQFNIKDMADRHALNEPHEMQAKVSFFTGANSLLPELTRLRSELQQERELRKELVEVVENYVDLEKLAWPERIESLIKKSKAK